MLCIYWKYLLVLELPIQAHCSAETITGQLLNERVTLAEPAVKSTLQHTPTRSAAYMGFVETTLEWNALRGVGTLPTSDGPVKGEEGYRRSDQYILLSNNYIYVSLYPKNEKYKYLDLFKKGCNRCNKCNMPHSQGLKGAQRCNKCYTCYTLTPASRQFIYYYPFIKGKKTQPP